MGRGKAIRANGATKLVADIRVYAHPELKDLAGKAADAEGLALSEFVARVLANHLRRPDLAVIPRKKPGRPRKRLTWTN